MEELSDLNESIKFNNEKLNILLQQIEEDIKIKKEIREKDEKEKLEESKKLEKEKKELEKKQNDELLSVTDKETKELEFRETLVTKLTETITYQEELIFLNKFNMVGFGVLAALLVCVIVSNTIFKR